MRNLANIIVKRIVNDTIFFFAFHKDVFACLVHMLYAFGCCLSVFGDATQGRLMVGTVQRTKKEKAHGWRLGVGNVVSTY